MTTLTRRSSPDFEGDTDYLHKRVYYMESVGSKRQKAETGNSRVSPRKTSMKQAKEKVTEQTGSSTSSVSPRKAPKRQANKKSTEEKDSCTSCVSPRKAPKTQAKEELTEEKSGKTSTSQRKPKANNMASAQAAGESTRQTETKMEISDTTETPDDSKGKQEVNTDSDAKNDEAEASVKLKASEVKQAGNELFKRGYTSSAIQKYEEVEKMLENPEVYEQEKQQVLFKIYLNLSLCHIILKEPAKSLDYGKKAISIDPDDSKALFRCGKAYSQMNELSQAVKFMEQAAMQCPKDPAIKKELAEIRKKLDGACGTKETTGSKSSILPLVYEDDDEDVSFHERMEVYGEEMLVDCKYGEVETGVKYYLGEHVRGEDWKAVWRSHDLLCDVLVKVTNARRFPDAEVELVEPFCAEPNSFGGPGGDGQQLKTKEEVQKFLTAKQNRVPLKELYPVCEDVEEQTSKDGEDRESDEESEFGGMEETARALEYYRFFYSCVWRVMDEFENSNAYFFMKDLQPRLEMYYDVKNKKVSDSVGKLYTDTMKEYQEVNRAFQSKRFAPNAKDEAKKLWVEVGKLYELLNKLDDPGTRDQCQMRASKIQVTHLVADKFTPELIQSANLDKGTTTKQHKTLASALKSSFNLDTILIFPGRYSGKGFEEISKDIVIKGAGKSPSDVVITYPQNTFVCMESTAYELVIYNVTFEGLPPISQRFVAALLVSQGTVQLSNCIFKSFAEGLQTANCGHLKVDKCEIYDIAGSAIAVELYCKLFMGNTHIHHCGGFTTSGEQPKKKKTASKMPECSKAGVFIQARYSSRPPSQTDVYMTDNKVEYTGGPGVWLQIHGYDAEFAFGDKPETKAYTNIRDFDMAAMMAGLDWFSNKCEFKENVGGSGFMELAE